MKGTDGPARSGPKPRILFVCFADSTHSQAWMGLLKDSVFDVRVFTVPLRVTHVLPPSWPFPTYVAVEPDRSDRETAKVFSLFPRLPRMLTLFNWVEDRFDLSVRWLRRVIRHWKPDIIHSMPLNVGGKLARLALEGIDAAERPTWVASAWGSDLYFGVDDPGERENIDYILRHCDAFFADCRRDRRLAVEAGLDERKLALDDAVPGVGGLDLDLFARIRSGARERDVIIVPKAFDRPLATRVMPVLEALRIADERLEGFEVHLFMCNEAAETWMRRMPESLRRKCRCRQMIPRSELLELMGRARLVVSPSLSDGTPNVMLEAMAAGALPVASPIDSIQEWIEDGENGLFARALYPNEIAEAISRGIADEGLFRRAAETNWQIVRERADRTRIREEVLAFYDDLAKASPPRGRDRGTRERRSPDQRPDDPVPHVQQQVSP